MKNENMMIKLLGAMNKDNKIVKCKCGSVFRAFDRKHHNFFCSVAQEDMVILDSDVTSFLFSEEKSSICVDSSVN